MKSADKRHIVEKVILEFVMSVQKINGGRIDGPVFTPSDNDRLLKVVACNFFAPFRRDKKMQFHTKTLINEMDGEDGKRTGKAIRRLLRGYGVKEERIRKIALEKIAFMFQAHLYAHKRRANTYGNGLKLCKCIELIHVKALLTEHDLLK